MPTTILETEKIRMRLDDNGIMTIEACLPNVEIDLEDAKQVTNAGASLSRGRKYPLLGDARGLKSITREARIHLTGRATTSKYPGGGGGGRFTHQPNFNKLPAQREQTTIAHTHIQLQRRSPCMAERLCREMRRIPPA